MAHTGNNQLYLREMGCDDVGAYPRNGNHDHEPGRKSVLLSGWAVDWLLGGRKASESLFEELKERVPVE